MKANKACEINFTIPELAKVQIIIIENSRVPRNSPENAHCKPPQKVLRRAVSRPPLLQERRHLREHLGSLGQLEELRRRVYVRIEEQKHRHARKLAVRWIHGPPAKGHRHEWEDGHYRVPGWVKRVHFQTRTKGKKVRSLQIRQKGRGESQRLAKSEQENCRKRKEESA